MTQQTLSLQKQETPPPAGSYVMKFSTKVFLVVLLLGVLWLRLTLRRRSRDKVCSHCGHRNPPHRSNCTKCSAPLFGR
jgi:hypothetical protein